MKVVRSRAVWSVVAFILLGLFVVRWMDASGGPKTFQARWGNIAPLVTLSLHAFLAVSPFIPSDGLCIANGMLYGFWMGALLSWVGWWVAGIVAFQIGARARRDLDLERIENQLPRWLRALPIGHPLYLILVRQIPGIGGDATTFLPGAAGVPLIRHLWCSALAIIPGALLFSAIGVGIVGR